MLSTLRKHPWRYTVAAVALFLGDLSAMQLARPQVGGGAAGGGSPAGALQANGPVPTLSGCGTGPSVANNANNVFGTVVEGTSATGCTLTWGATRAGNPVCILQFRTSGLPVTAVTTESASALTWTNASGQGTFDYICAGS